MDLTFSLTVIIPVTAVLLTIYQAHIQRVHNIKSVTPLPQIDVMDKDRVLFVHIQNNGVGPMIVEKITFYKNGQEYNSIQDCLEIDPKSFDHIEIRPTNKKVVIPGGFLDVFSKKFDEEYTDEQIVFHRHQLSLLILKVEGRDVYNNRVVIDRDLHWFARHINSD